MKIVRMTKTTKPATVVADELPVQDDSGHPPLVVRKQHQTLADKLYTTLNLPKDSSYMGPMLRLAMAAQLAKGVHVNTLKLELQAVRAQLATAINNVDRKAVSTVASSGNRAVGLRNVKVETTTSKVK